MMGRKSAQTKLVYGGTLDQWVPDTHFVRALDAAVDWEVIRKLSRRYFSQLGQPSVDPVVLFKLVVLGYWEGIRSERRMCEMAAVNMAWRWFLQYELGEPIFDHSVLTKFRTRTGRKFWDDCLTEVVRLCSQQGLLPGKTVYVDATLIDADASMQSRSRALLEEVAPVEEYVTSLFVVNDPEEEEKPKGPRPPREKKARGKGLQPQGNGPKSEGFANRMMASRTDLDAEFFRKGDDPLRLCHKAQAAVDGGAARIITAIEVTPATEHDSHAAPMILAQHAKNVGWLPQEGVFDKGYSSKDVYRYLDELGIDALIPPKDYVNSNGAYNREEFIYDLANNVYICPEGHALKEFSINTSRGSTTYRPAPRTCTSCVHELECAPGKSDRTITRSWSQDLVDQARARLETPRGAALYAARGNKSEGPFAELKTQGQMHRAKFRGRVKMQIQACGEAITYDLKRLIRAHQYVAQGAAGAVSAPVAVLNVLFSAVSSALWDRCHPTTADFPA